VADPQTIDEWLNLARTHEVSARLLCEDKVAAAQALFHVGLAVEAALKALIMKRERFNDWPSKAARPDLYTHRLPDLLRLAGVMLSRTDPLAASWHVVLAWDRNQGYDPKAMPRKVARAWVEAAFGEKGAVTWIRTTLA
jgi:hypothetical protein